TSPHPITQNTLIDRFSPIYWRIDGPQTTSFAITNYGNGFEASFRSRMTNDLVGISRFSDPNSRFRLSGK
ncbi:hypothetical protein M9Y34_16975, partial [Acinetobacter baumannii]